MKKLLLALALTASFAAVAEDYKQLPNPDIDVRGYTIKDVRVLEGSDTQTIEYDLPALEKDTYWTGYRVCMTTTPAFIDWDNNIYFPIDEPSRVKLTALVDESPNVVKSWVELCSPLALVGKGDTVKVTLQNFRTTDTVNKISIKLFNETINLK